MKASRDGRDLVVTELPSSGDDGTPIELSELRVEVRYSSSDRDVVPRYVKGLALDHVVLPRLLEALNVRESHSVFSVRTVVQCLSSQGMSCAVVRSIVWDMLDMEERQQHPAHGISREVTERFRKLREEELPAVLSSIYSGG